MKKDLIDTIIEKDFNALTEVEREELQAYCASEDEYNQMKDVFLGMEQMSWEQPKPKAETKQRLDDLFDATYPKAAPVWYNSTLALVVPKDKPIYRQPLAQIAAIALLALLLVPFWNTGTTIEKSAAAPQIAQAEPVEKTQESRSVTSEPTADINEEKADFKDDVDTRSNETPVMVASSEPHAVPAPSPSVASGASATAMEDHPDGVFVAESLPASDAPEVLDLLTATF
ncbi:MAG: hypothetical protein ACFHU9_03440 [Fluviicola sp.]